MNPSSQFFHRRHFLRTLSITSTGLVLPTLWFDTPGAFAEELTKTPAQTEGPFYPDRLPLDTDNDLIIVNDSLTPAVGEITHLTGKVMDLSGNPLRNAVVEIWQVDNNGVYLHTGDRRQERRDANFQGFGRFLTSSNGEYYFRTIKPQTYPGRAPHIHVKVLHAGGEELLTTQCYIKGHPQNDGDGIFNRIREPEARAAVEVDFEPIENSTIGELKANFDIILGLTPA